MLPPFWWMLMPRYHFNVHNGEELIDRVGTELPNIVFARREAIRFAGKLLDEGAGDILPGNEWRMDVTDVSGLILFQLDFNVSQSPAAAAAVKG